MLAIPRAWKALPFLAVTPFLAATLLAILLNLGLAGACSAQGMKSLELIPPGTIVDPSGSKVVPTSDASWNKIFLLAQPRIASGDTDALGQSIQDTVSSFVLTIMGTVEPYQMESGEEKFRLAQVGVGYSTFIDNQLTVVSSTTQRQQGANLGLFARQMLKTNEEQLQTARLAAKTSTICVFDTPSLLARQGKHVDFITRHFIWIDSKTGRCSTLVWLIQQSNDGEWRLANEPMRWLPANFKEDRKIHVDGDQFLLGIPNERAFALEDLPPGRKVEWNTAARTLAAEKGLDTDSLRELTSALNECLQQLRNDSKQAQTD